MKIIEMSGTFVVNDEGYPIALLWKNTHVVGFELKEYTLEKFTRLLTSLVGKETNV